MTTPIIGVAGPAGCGKSTFADILIEKHGFVRIKVSGPLKAMLRAIGLTDREIEGDLKERPCPLLCGQTPRHAMVTLGTEWGRELIDPDFWSTAWAVSAERAISAGAKGIVADDVRYPNEANAVRRLGGSVVRLIGRAGVAASSGHSSEAGAFAVDAELNNAGSVEDLERLAAGVVRHLCQPADEARHFA